MNVLIFGGTGMLGQGTILECITSSDVNSVTSIGRRPSHLKSPKLRNIIHQDMWDYSAIEDQLRGFDACLFCLGVSSAGMDEATYAHLTYDLTISAASTLSKLNPDMAFVYVSGAGTDSTEQGSSMWARVKGKTENALLKLPFKRTLMLRPGVIQPLDGIKSKTKLYQILYTLLKPALIVSRELFPNYIATTRTVATAMIQACKYGYDKSILYSRDIEALSRSRNKVNDK